MPRKEVICIDPGHGGIDVGKVSITGDYEKDINLSIAKKTKKYLELENFAVYLTRENDNGLYNEKDSNKKAVDMKNRIDFIERKNPALTISIHQNSYIEESSCGAQVFYYTKSEEGKQIAKYLQLHLITALNPENSRTIMGNTDYYLLKNTTSPTVICECGFLSNEAEAELLSTDAYQDQVAQAIADGILDYMNQKRAAPRSSSLPIIK